MADKNRITLTVNAGEHDRDSCPVSVDIGIRLKLKHSRLDQSPLRIRRAAQSSPPTSTATAKPRHSHGF